MGRTRSARIGMVFLAAGLLAGCIVRPVNQATQTASPRPISTTAMLTATPPAPTPSETATATPTFTPTATPSGPVPDFSHIIVIFLENKEFGTVIGNSRMPNFNQWAKDYTLLTQYYGVRHPSLPNYLAVIGGDTFGITSDCENCFVNAPSLPDLIEASGRTWKTYQEDMPSPCFVGSRGLYAQKHNPFIYFDPIRLDKERCQRSILPLSELDNDLAKGDLANFIFITPNECNDAHSCPLEAADQWLYTWVNKLMGTRLYDERSLIVLTWDEGQGDHSCCGLPEGGGRVATVLISPLVKTGFQDDTPYSHYSLLKTISVAWGLPELGHAGDSSTNLIIKPWKGP